MNPPDDIPPHVWANLELNAELCAEYWSRGRSRSRRIVCQSSTARIRGAVYTNFFDELEAAIEDIEARAPKPVAKVETVDSILGLTPAGCSEVMPRMGKGSHTRLHGENH